MEKGGGSAPPTPPGRGYAPLHPRERGTLHPVLVLRTRLSGGRGEVRGAATSRAIGEGYGERSVPVVWYHTGVRPIRSRAVQRPLSSLYLSWPRPTVAVGHPVQRPLRSLYLSWPRPTVAVEKEKASENRGFFVVAFVNAVAYLAMTRHISTTLLE